MPAGSLHFLRPLYDIARWQYLLMSGKCTADRKKVHKVKMFHREHKIIAYFLCKLLRLPAYEHLAEQLQKEDVQKASDGWKVGDKPTDKLIKWCLDQWRRMSPICIYDRAREVSSPVVIRVSCLPCCHLCGAICENCADDMGKTVPQDELQVKMVGRAREREFSMDQSISGDDDDWTEPNIAERVKRRRTAES